MTTTFNETMTMTIKKNNENDNGNDNDYDNDYDDADNDNDNRFSMCIRANIYGVRKNKALRRTEPDEAGGRCRVK